MNAYSNKSADAARLRTLAVLTGERAVVERVVPRQARRLTPAEIAEFCEAYRRGGNVREWARKLDVHRSALHEIVRKHGLERLSGIVTPEQQVLADAYAQGATLAELAAQHHMGPHRVARQLHAAGVELRPRGRRPS
ncbi:hypothetical protein [Microbacterium sp. 67-17]|uniref:hypothetical protein n=1 Tax=Microbacterium sp. 67-17 TaxID=1895782 RepID=UPI0025F85003|nr:hypothetical protein [Microbacterium sp. 67-17]